MSAEKSINPVLNIDAVVVEYPDSGKIRLHSEIECGDPRTSKKTYLAGDGMTAGYFDGEDD